MNSLFVNAVTAHLKICQRLRIDAAFARMAGDANYQREAALIAEEFGVSDWEALRLQESDPQGDLL